MERGSAMVDEETDRSTIRVAVIDDHLLVRDGLASALRQDGFDVPYAGCC